MESLNESKFNKMPFPLNWSRTNENWKQSELIEKLSVDLYHKMF